MSQIKDSYIQDYQSGKLEEGYYIVNSGKAILYWDGTKWMQPVKDATGRLFSFVREMDKQPVKIKSLHRVFKTY
jgi:hypothetical protein